jgi:hypothetical protein
MAIITSGSLADFSIRPTDTAYESVPAADQVDNFGVLAEVARDVPADVFKFDVSPAARGLALAHLRLRKGFQLGFQKNPLARLFARLFRRTREVYFIAWCWDLSGMPVSVYPGAAADPSSVLIPMRGGDIREFMGAGALLFPARPVTAGLAVRIQIWESARAKRNFGTTLSSVADVIQKSELNSLLTVVAAAAGVATATVALVEQAALQLAKTVGEVLKESSDNYVDFFEGYFPAASPWTNGKAVYSGTASEIALSQF